MLGKLVKIENNLKNKSNIDNRVSKSDEICHSF